jgi:hypothetical protein
MPMDGNNNRGNKGFSGLSGLVSEVRGIDEPIKKEPKSESKPSTIEQPPQPKQKSASSEPEPKATSSPPPIEKVSSAKRTGGSAGKWIFGIIGVVFVVWLINNGGQSNKKPSKRPSSSKPSYSYPQSSAASPNKAPNVTQRAGLQYIKPSAGTSNLLSVPKIRWCIREGIRIEAMRGVIDTNVKIDAFNRIVNDYNRRCGSYRYRRGSRSRAERDVELYRAQIVSEAIHDAINFGSPYQPSHLSGLPGTSRRSHPKKPSAQITREAQQILTDLGYDPGPIDGDYGRRTAEAVKRFQKDLNFEQYGWIDKDLLKLLREKKAVNHFPANERPSPKKDISKNSNVTKIDKQENDINVPINPDEIKANLRPSTDAPSMPLKQPEKQSERNSKRTTSIENDDYFSIGSHKNIVLKLQGRPDVIYDYSHLGYEEWKYGKSSVKISTRDNRVISWDNIGDLKAQKFQIDNKSASKYFSRGSHQDDVIKIQGYPDLITDYSALGYKEWTYGRNTVKISTHNHCVISWDDSGNLKAK